jgi:misacylated tRNA(Ala) deacylase
VDHAVTELLFRDDAYLASCEAEVVAAGPGGLVLNRTVFYPRAGGQPGDTGRILFDGAEVALGEAVKGPDGFAVLHPVPEGSRLPHAGQMVTVEIDFARRLRHMRVHTAMHLLCSLIPGAGVTGGSIGDLKGRLDFDLPAAPDREALEAGFARLVAENLPVSSEWISEDALDANPALVRTLSVQPPRGSGRVRLVRIGGDPAVDLQPCGGTHVRATSEIGVVRVAKVENKGKANRRVNLVVE